MPDSSTSRSHRKSGNSPGNAASKSPLVMPRSGIALELRFGHHRLRQHRGARDLLRANHDCMTLMMQSEQAEQRDPEDRHRDHHFEQSKSRARGG